MLLQEGPADTLDFMILGLGVILAVMAIFLASLIVRYRNLAEDLELLRQVQAEGEEGQPPAAG